MLQRMVITIYEGYIVYRCYTDWDLTVFSGPAQAPKGQVGQVGVVEMCTVF